MPCVLNIKHVVIFLKIINILYYEMLRKHTTTDTDTDTSDKCIVFQIVLWVTYKK